jgi:hypothetical protein
VTRGPLSTSPSCGSCCSARWLGSGRMANRMGGHGWGSVGVCSGLARSAVFRLDAAQVSTALQIVGTIDVVRISKAK